MEKVLSVRYFKRQNEEDATLTIEQSDQKSGDLQSQNIMRKENVETSRQVKQNDSVSPSSIPSFSDVFSKKNQERKCGSSQHPLDDRTMIKKELKESLFLEHVQEGHALK